jgi:hypothetical protein
MATFSRYARISGWFAYVLLHRGLGAKEYEYRCDGTSHAAPGNVLWRHVPPNPSARSKMVNS